ncbi:hypothetical protein M441DRAFT_93645 [Trichoderma asperellum CBS 433.97]|uniref:Cupin type-2 domain-containing protein n=2 Tax=Trichoderma asperellum TaxID=101201 RepID=A0A2T3YTN5_TRIA4|nr:hypothetical protein M441DRAFT_93645 [Trichoderma asperellum CBS 433.97]PTB35866.1 hypothetical protein M441DRAFT_93645 [Trichoderma asperellum CBS 433.97]
MSSTTKKTSTREDIEVLFDHELTNAPGKSIIGLHLDYPPNGFTPPHRHGGATVVAYVMAGELLSGMNDNPPKVYKPGEIFIELPGCHHTVGENNLQTSSTQVIAIMVVDTEVVKTGGYAALTVLDEGW